MAIQRRISESPPPPKQEPPRRGRPRGTVGVYKEPPPRDPNKAYKMGISARERPKAEQKLAELAAREAERIEALLNDPERENKIKDIEDEEAAIHRRIEQLAMDRYELDKEINRLSIKLNHLDRVKVRLTLPY